VFDQNKARFGEPERRSGAFVRVPIKGDGSAARDTIQSLASSDDDLEARAAQTDDADYKSIDSKPQAELNNAVGDSLFTLDANQTSQPVKGENAWYLVYLDGVTAASQPAFDDPKVQARLKAMAGQQTAQQAFADKAERLESLAYEAPNELETLADELGLTIQSSDWITREQGPGIGQYDAVRKAAFSDAVVKDELNSTPIQLGAERRVVLRVAEHQAAERRPLDPVRDDIRERVAARKASEQASEAAAAALDEAQSGKGLQALANADQATLKQPGFVQRSNRELEPRILEAAFSLAKPEKNTPRYRVATTGNGTVVLVAIDAVREAGKGEDQTPRSEFAGQQRDHISRLEYAVLGDYLRRQVDIEINENRINR
jgi:peptidyl-prolyl cis-trans isomerase D